MRFVIQRVKESEVRVDGEVLGSIGKGFMVLIGVSNSDTKEIADKMIKKMLGLRIFEDGWKSAFDFSVYTVCKLQKRKSTKLYRGWGSGDGRGDV